MRWRDWRQLCAVAFLRLEDFLDNACHQLTLSLVPQGLLFAQVTPDPCLLITWVPGPLGGGDVEAQREVCRPSQGPVSLSPLPCFMVTVDKRLSSLGLSFPPAAHEGADSVSLSPPGSCVIATGGSGWDPGSWRGALAGGWEGTGLPVTFCDPQVTFCDPVIERRPRLQRQKRIFSKRRGTDRRGLCVWRGGQGRRGWEGGPRD